MAQTFIYDQYVLIAVIVSITIGIPIFCRLLSISSIIKNFAIKLSEHSQRAFYLSLLDNPSFSLNNPLIKGKEDDKTQRKLTIITNDAENERRDQDSPVKSNRRNSPTRKIKSQNVIDLSDESRENDRIESSLDDPITPLIHSKSSPTNYDHSSSKTKIKNSPTRKSTNQNVNSHYFSESGLSSESEKFPITHSLDDPITQRIYSKLPPIIHGQSNEEDTEHTRKLKSKKELSNLDDTTKKSLSRKDVNTVAIDTEDNDSPTRSSIRKSVTRKSMNTTVNDFYTSDSALSTEFTSDTNPSEHLLDEPITQHILPKSSPIIHSYKPSIEDEEFRKNIKTHPMIRTYSPTVAGSDVDTFSSHPPSPLRKFSSTRIHSSSDTGTDTMSSNPPSPIQRNTYSQVHMLSSNPPSPTRIVRPTRRWRATSHGIWNGFSEKILSDLVNNQSNRTLSGKFEECVDDDDEEQEEEAVVDEPITVNIKPKKGNNSPKKSTRVKSLNFNFNFENGQRKYRNRYRRYLLTKTKYTGMKPWIFPKGE